MASRRERQTPCPRAGFRAPQSFTQVFTWPHRQSYSVSPKWYPALQVMVEQVGVPVWTNEPMPQMNCWDVPQLPAPQLLLRIGTPIGPIPTGHEPHDKAMEAPHLLALATPQLLGPVQAPHARFPPHPSGIVPHSAPCTAQVVLAHPQ